MTLANKNKEPWPKSIQSASGSFDTGFTESRPVVLSRIFTRDPAVWFMVAAFAIVSFVFYNTEFRDVLEDWFFDLRMRWAPQVQTADDILIVGIDDQGISQLDETQTRIQYDGKHRPYLSIESLTNMAGLLANSDAVSISYLLPNHVVPHTDERLAEFIEIVRFDQRMLIGTTEYNRPDPGVVQIPYPLASIEDRVFGIETFRRRSNVIVRALPYTGYRGLNEELMLPVKVAGSVSGKFGDLKDFYSLYHRKPQAFRTISAGLAKANPREFLDAAKGKTVIVGYTVNREIPFQTTDMMLVNTPLVGQQQTVDHGIPMTYLIANAVENLLHDRILRPTNSVFNFIQTIAVAGICGLAWELGSLAASAITVAIWIALIYVHGLVFSYTNMVVPLADSFLACALVAIFAAVRRLRFELQQMAAQRVTAESKAEIAKMQSHFLSEFAIWLKQMTELILEKMRATQAAGKLHTPGREDLYRRAYAAGEDFGEYLESIRQIPEMENAPRSGERRKIDLTDFLQRIVRRFELKIQDKNMEVIFDIKSKKQTILVNANLLDSIIFNFISNAVKYSPPHTKLVIKTSTNQNKETVISVIDEGPGIPEDMQGKIFEKFYRIQDDRIYKAKGSGLGLYLCRFFAESIGGRVDVRSAPGKGSEFRVILP